MMEFAFEKMHGLGNCFVLMDDRSGQVSGAADPSRLAVKVCDRDFGIGADGLILVQPSPRVDFTMTIINEDGSEAEMCGNGVRCFARWVFERGLTDRRELAIDTGAGVIRTRLLDDGHVEVDMGEPSLRSPDVVAGDASPVAVEEQDRRFVFVSMGNPHAVTFVEAIDFDWEEVGARVEVASAFPNRTNVHFVRPIGPGEVEVKVWERGCGPTKACGTGACAVAVAGALEDRLPRDPVTVHLPGGPLRIHWRPDNHVMMTGPTEDVCRGSYLYSD